MASAMKKILRPLRVRRSIVFPLFQAWEPTVEEAMRCFQSPDVQWAMLQHAERAHKYAVAYQHIRPLSYRGFNVAAFAAGLKPIPGRQGKCSWDFTWDINTKPHKNAPKYCAEMRVFRRARARGWLCMPCLAVVGYHQPEEPWPTLHPCRDCRTQMRTPLYCPFMLPKTLILTAEPGIALYEEYTFERLMRYHSDSPAAA